MKRWTHALLYVVCFPQNLVSWLAVLVIRALWGEDLEWESPTEIGRPGGPVLTVSLREDSWPSRTWYRKWGGTTLGHAIMYAHGRRARAGERWEPIQVHEHVHVEQFEAAMLKSLVVGLAVAIMLHSIAGVMFGVAIWSTGYVAMGAANWTTAWLRGEDPYRGSHHEEAAYAIDEIYERGHE